MSKLLKFLGLALAISLGNIQALTQAELSSQEYKDAYKEASDFLVDGKKNG